MTASQDTIITNVIDKLDALNIDFQITDTDIVPALNDTMREIGVTLDDVQANSVVELNIELRTEYWMLHRFKNSQVLNFKYSTSIDGRTIDKTNIPTIIENTMNDLDTRFKAFIAGNSFKKPTVGIWDITPRTNTRLI